MSIAVLGPIVFEVNADLVRTWQELRRSGTARWATHEVFGSKPKKEFLGPGLEKIEIPIRLDATKGVIPKKELAQMREQRDAGNVLQFTVGGELVGDFAIEDIQETHRHTLNTGELVVADAVLTLEEYQ